MEFNFTTFVGWAFEGILAGCALYGVQTLKGLRESVDDLNQQMATILERDSWHTRWLEKHDVQIQDLQTKDSQR